MKNYHILIIILLMGRNGLSTLKLVNGYLVGFKYNIGCFKSSTLLHRESPVAVILNDKANKNKTKTR